MDHSVVGVENTATTGGCLAYYRRLTYIIILPQRRRFDHGQGTMVPSSYSSQIIRSLVDSLASFRLLDMAHILGPLPCGEQSLQEFPQA